MIEPDYMARRVCCGAGAPPAILQHGKARKIVSETLALHEIAQSPGRPQSRLLQSVNRPYSTRILVPC